MPDGAADVSVLRVVVREGFSADLARSLWEDLRAVLNHLDAIWGKPTDPSGRI
jgi:glutamate decarboxylase